MLIKKMPASVNPTSAGKLINNLFDINSSLLGCQDKIGASGIAESLRSEPDALINLPTRPNVLRRVNSQTERILGNPHREEMQKKSGYVGIDWIHGNIGFRFVDKAAKYLSNLFNSDYIVYEFGRHRYDRTISFESYGVNIFYDSSEERSANLHGYKSLLQFTGTALSFLTAYELMDLITDLFQKFAFNCSRIDPFFDDMTKRIRPQDLDLIAKQGNVSGFRKARYCSGDYEIGKPDTINGEGMYFGSRGKNGSGKFLRVYDKELETRGRIKSIRWEPELTKGFAEKAFMELYKVAGDIERFTATIGGLVGGCICFVNRTSKPKEKNIPRLGVLPFWIEICEELGVVRLKNPQKVSTIETSIGWVERSVASPLVKIRKALGPEKFFSWLFDQMDEKESCMTLKQRIEIEAYWNNNSKFDDIPI